MGTVRALRDDSFSRVVEIAAPPELLRHVVKKGSIAVDDAERTYSTSLAQWSRRARRDRRRKPSSASGPASSTSSTRSPARQRSCARPPGHPSATQLGYALYSEMFVTPSAPPTAPASSSSMDFYVVWDLAIETLAPTRERL
jgi:hypothetical protein